MRHGGGWAPMAAVATVAAMVLFSFPGTASGEQVFNANLTSTNNTYPLSSSESAAQSFVPDVSFALYNVTIRVQNVGTKGDSLNVTIQTDAAGGPSGTILAGSVEGQSGSNWLDFPMTPRPVLTAGGTYWIVATGAMAGGQRYA